MVLSLFLFLRYNRFYHKFIHRVQLMTEKDGDTKKRCQKPAVQQKTTDYYYYYYYYYYLDDSNCTVQ